MTCARGASRSVGGARDPGPPTQEPHRKERSRCYVVDQQVEGWGAGGSHDLQAPGPCPGPGTGTPLLRSESEISFIPTGCVSRWSSFKIFVFVWPMTWMGTDLQAAIPPDCQKETLQVSQGCVPEHNGLWAPLGRGRELPSPEGAQASREGQ